MAARTLVYIKNGKSVHQFSEEHRDDLRSNHGPSALLRDVSPILRIHEGDDLASQLIKKLRRFEDPHAMIDVAIPYGDSRGDRYLHVWIFDLDREILIWVRSDVCLSAPFELVRNREDSYELRAEDFAPFSEPSFPQPRARDFRGPHWDLQVDQLPREKVFLGKMVQDYAHTWRHLLRRRPNDAVLLTLSHALVRILFLDFSIVERSRSYWKQKGFYSWVTRLPRWPCPESNFIIYGRTCIVVHADLSQGKLQVEKYRKHPQSYPDLPQRPTSRPHGIQVYVILSLRFLVFGRQTAGGALEWTGPETLFDGKQPASEQALDRLLWVARTQRRVSKATCLHGLPLEIQDEILRLATASSVAAAKLGCELELGSTFSWRGNENQALELITSSTIAYRRNESQIWFGSSPSGVSYAPERSHAT